MRVAAILTILAAAACSRGTASGTLVDYATGKPIGAARIAAHASGWGISSRQLVWDKSYSSSAITDSEGRFTVSLPGPRPLVFGTSTLSVEADGYQQLSEIIARAGEKLLVQATRTVPRERRVPGGLAYVGITESGERFGWSFVRNRPTTDMREADIALLDSARSDGRAVRFSASPPGGLLFISRERQRLASASYGMFLRYPGEAPADGYRSAIEMDPRGTGGTIFVRTAAGRFAKVAFTTPLSTVRGSIPLPGTELRAAWALPLPFAYNPFPGRSLDYDPGEPSGAVDPAIAGAAAELAGTGAPQRGERSYLISVEDDAGTIIDSVTVRLSPGAPLSVGDRSSNGYRFADILLSHGSHGLAALRLTIESHAAAYHTAEIIPNSRFAVSRDFDDYTGDGRPLHRVLRIIEVR